MYATALEANAGKPLPPRLGSSNFSQPIYDGASQTYAQTNTNWQDALFKSALITQTHLSMSGATDISRFYSSGGYFKQNGTLAGTGYERGNFRLNSDHNLSKRIKVGQTLTFAYGNRKNEIDPANSQGRSLIMHMIRSLPYLPIYDPTKLGGYRGADANDGSDPENPILLANYNSDKTTTSKFFGTVFAEYQITDWLKFRSTEGIDYTNGTRKVYLPIYNDGFNSKPLAALTQQVTATTSVLFSNQLSFNKNWGRHTVNAIAVAEQQSYSVSDLLTNGNLSYNQVQQLNGVSDANITGTLQKNYLISYLGRINYDFGGKYLLGVSFRSDGSSKFAPGHRWGTFPAASAGWRISQENFMKSIAAISELKVRGSYGLVGFNGLGNYDWQSTERTDLTLYNFGSGNVSGSYFNSLPNPNLKWETSKMTNIGFDLGLFNNRFTFSAEYFNKLTENLILPLNIAPSLGYTIFPVTNIGSMRNRGFELQAGYHINKGGFKSSLTGNMGFVRNKVLKLTTPSADIQAGYNPDFGGYNITITKAGLPVQSFYGWETDGIFQSQDEIDRSATQTGAAPGDIKFKDLNGDGVIDDNDRKVLGSYLPKFTYGINYNASYKNFDLSIFFQGSYGNKIYNGTKVLTEGMVRLFNSGTNVLNAWTPTNTNTDVPRAVDGDPNHNARTSNRFLESGSYLRLKNVALGYTIPEKLVKGITGGNLSSIRIYASSQNLLTFTKYTGYDPEVALGPRLAGAGGANTGTSVGVGNLLTSGVDYGQAPVARSFLGGIQIGF
jgi:TonB-linked SusC/RagA family outer membrane protein